MGNQLLSTRDVAERLQVNIRTAQRIVRSMPHVNVGMGKKNEYLRVTEEMLDAYISERTVMPFCPRPTRTAPSVVRRVSSAGTGKLPRRRE